MWREVLGWGRAGSSRFTHNIMSDSEADRGLAAEVAEPQTDHHQPVTELEALHGLYFRRAAVTAARNDCDQQVSGRSAADSKKTTSNQETCTVNGRHFS